MRDEKINAALNTGDFAGAMKEIDKKIRTYPNSSFFYAAKAQTLAMQGKRDEALKQATTLMAKYPSDPSTLATITKTYDLCEYDPPMTVWETVTKKYPSFELIFEWFNECINDGDIVGLQKATMMMTKSIGGGGGGHGSQCPANVDTRKRLTKLWAATGFFLVCKCCPSRANLKLYPMLGLRLVETAKPQNAQEYYLYCQLLDLVGQQAKCIETLEKFLAKENDLELKLMYFDLLERTGNFEKLYIACIRYLVDLQEDDWDTWKLAIKAASKTGRLETIQPIIDSYQQGRNKQLCYLELTRYDSVASDSAKEQALLAYIGKYGHKKCCYPDLKQFIADFKFSSSVLKSSYDKIAPVLTGEKKAEEKDLGLMVNYLKFKADLDRSLFNSPEFVTECCQFYNSTKHLLADLQEFDFFPGFEFIILAVQSLLTQSTSTAGPECYLRLIVILENALLKNPYEFHLKLWLISLYIKVNCLSRAHALFEGLKCKFAQLDTLSPLVLTRYSSLTQKNELIVKVAHFYDKNVQAEVPSMIMNCFEKLALSKIQGFFEFEIRLNSSATLLLDTLESVRSARTLNDTRSIQNESRPLLRKFYKIWKTAGNDIDQRINDNRDEKTMWDCGIHEVIESASTQLNKFNPQVDEPYLVSEMLKELLIYDYKSANYDEYISAFLKSYRAIPTTLTAMEKWNLSVIAHIFDDSVPIDSLPEKPESTFDFNYNHCFFVLSDTLHEITDMLGSHNNTVQKRIDCIKELKQNLTTAVRAMRYDVAQTRAKARADAESSQKSVTEWFVNGDGKQFEIEASTVASVFEDIVYANVQSMGFLSKA